MTTPDDATSEVARGARQDRWMLLAVVACCAALPLALVALGITAGSLASGRYWLLALAGILAVGAGVAHRASSRRDRC